ncbi:hypothetical protein B7494_g8242 [Chlorociboria aeruginascens]|nr:hypothetical protein B7494_g8242 [Chlorociboria aeruginascens]
MEDYNKHVEAFREEEYPMLKDAIYLDHAGSALYSKSLTETFASDMMSNLYGNPHSGSDSSQLSTHRIDDTRMNVLKFFKADLEHFDVIFVANATAGMKLVMDAFREHDEGFAYGYHRDSHTSLVGIRENSTASRCLDDEAVERWLSSPEALVEEALDCPLNLFAYPAQSNMNGRQLPLEWIPKARQRSMNGSATYTLLDASGFVSTSQLDLSNVMAAADFTVLSFYKIFGFPDLGALIVRKESGNILRDRKYFGGGTVDMVLCVKEVWHVSKEQSLHDSLEDGTLPFHNIIALDAAIKTHRKLYGSMDQISRHTRFLAQRLFDGLASLRHGNSEPLCVIHSPGFLYQSTCNMQGPVIAFNMKNSYGAWISNTEFEKLASVRKFHIRTGGLCNPGGIATTLSLEPWEMRQNFSAGFRCGSETDIYSGKITGVTRVSLGAMSTINDVDTFLSFVREFYVEEHVPCLLDHAVPTVKSSDLFVESLTIYPIKSCGGMSIPPGASWELRPEGLARDREWCLVHQGSGQALSQKSYPRMALIRPIVDFQRGLLRIRYSCQVVNNFFSTILEVPCALARFPAGGSGPSQRHMKTYLQRPPRVKNIRKNGIPESLYSPPTPPDSDNEMKPRPILLSNESPILTINRSSIDMLNKEIAMTGAYFGHGVSNGWLRRLAYGMPGLTAKIWTKTNPCLSTKIYRHSPYALGWEGRDLGQLRAGVLAWETSKAFLDVSSHSHVTWIRFPARQMPEKDLRFISLLLPCFQPIAIQLSSFADNMRDSNELVSSEPLNLQTLLTKGTLFRTNPPAPPPSTLCLVYIAALFLDLQNLRTSTLQQHYLAVQYDETTSDIEAVSVRSYFPYLNYDRSITYCNSDGNCAMNANQQDSKPGTTASTTTSTTNASSATSAAAVADSSCPSFPTDAVLAGFFPGLLVGIIIAVVGICIFGAKRRKDAGEAGRRNSSSFGNISDPQPSADLRSDFLRRNSQSPGFMGRGMGMGMGMGMGTGMGMNGNPPGLQRAGTVQRVRSLFRKSTSTNNSHTSPNMQQRQSPAMPPIPLTVSKSPHTPSNYGASSEYGDTPVISKLQREPSYEDINIFADGDTASALRERARENGMGLNSPPLLSPPVLRGGQDDEARNSNITSFGDMMEKSGGLAGLSKGQQETITRFLRHPDRIPNDHNDDRMKARDQDIALNVVSLKKGELWSRNE